MFGKYLNQISKYNRKVKIPISIRIFFFINMKISAAEGFLENMKKIYIFISWLSPC